MLTPDVCRTLVQGLVLSHVDYCDSLYVGLPEVTLKPLQHVQNYAARLILTKNRFDSGKDCLATLHWLPTRERIHFKVLCIVYKALNDTAPTNLTNLFTIREPVYGLRNTGSDARTLTRPQTRTNFLIALSGSLA